jgi:carboxylesterase type B
MTAGGSEQVQRDESEDDYDLLTYNEVAARLSEEMTAESRRIAELEQSGSEPAAVRAMRDRLALLEASKVRYEQQAKTAEVFMRRFGLTPRRADSANQ